MPGIFISYRREDTAGHAGRIFDRLREKFGGDKVFMDVAGIEPGVDFVEAIDQAVGSCDVLLVIIGKQWLTCDDASGKRRLDDPKDFIRLETATALRRDIRVIPVLVQDAAMPGDGDLPDDLKKLARRQATEISDTHWDTDTGQLVETLTKLLHEELKPAQSGAVAMAHAPLMAGEKPAIHTPVPSGMGKNKFTWIISAIMALAVVLGGLLYFMPSYRDEAVVISPPAPQKAPEPETVMVRIPDFTGWPVRRVEDYLKEKGLILGPVKEKETSEHRAGTVIAQRPPAKTHMKKGDKVLLLVAVSAGEAAVLRAPEPTWPEEGRSFDNIPRTTALRWEAVSGAASYTVELDCLHCCESGKWCSDLGRPWKLARGIPAARSPGHKFEFTGAQQGRWRVWAVDKNGREGEKSPWRTFRYTR
ncbi:MAG: TIR domain-containing protein [Sulfuricella sp.]|jgi:hypothetical protein